MKLTRFIGCGVFLGLITQSVLAQSQDEQGLLELRNTVVNLLESLVEHGILTQEDAQAMVADAQQRAQAEVAEITAREEAEQDAVRVTYVPEIVRDEIQARVVEDVEDVVVDEVMARARDEGWGIPDALPDWVRNLDFSVDVRVRAQGDFFDEENAIGEYLNLGLVNERGGIGLAGPDALLNTTEDRTRLRGRLRVNVAAQIGDHVTTRFGLTTGNIDDPLSLTETFANYGRRLDIGVQTASIEWNLASQRQTRGLEIYAGRFENPFESSTLIWDPDLSFQGLAGRIAFDLFRRDVDGVDPGFFLSLGAFPLEEVELTADDKWLYASQLGMEIPLARRASFSWNASYYEFKNIVGLQNAPDSRLNDPTAPARLARGNTLFDIRNDLNLQTNLFALASEYEIANLNLAFDFRAFGENRIRFSADYVENRAFDPGEVESRTGEFVEPRTTGRRVGLTVGRTSIRGRGQWNVGAEYRYLERDAVVDAFTESNFGLGATDTEGYVVGFSYGISDKTWLQTRWFSSNEIDGPQLGIDILQLDLNARF